MATRNEVYDAIRADIASMGSAAAFVEAARAFAALDSERGYQDRRWNAETTVTEGKHEAAAFVLFAEDYLEQATGQQAGGSRDALHTIRKVGGLAIACMELHGAPMPIQALDGRTSGQVEDFIDAMERHLKHARQTLSRNGEPKASADAMHDMRCVATWTCICLQLHGAPLRA